MYSNTVLAVCNSRMTRRIRGGREETAFHSFESFDLSIGGLNIEFQDTETQRKHGFFSAARWVPPRERKSEDSLKIFLDRGSTADELCAKVRHIRPQLKQMISYIAYYSRRKPDR